ncbi:Uncharacterised protein [Serratia fonticola]|nr:Uncharacterised protein [Serratia fonticola]
MREGLIGGYRWVALPDFGSVRLPLPVGEGWGEGGLPISTDQHHLPESEFNTVKANLSGAF